MNSPLDTACKAGMMRAMSHLRDHPFLTAPRAHAFAHRGGSAEAEENTMAAFAHAVGLGYSHVELDVHATRDGVVVIHHDPDLARICGDSRRIADLDWSELRLIRTHGGARIPRLEDLFAEFPRLYVNIEAKSQDVVAPLCALIERLGVLERICIGAFDPARTRAARAALGPGLLWSPAHVQVAGLWARGWGMPFALEDFGVVQVPVSWNGITVINRRFVRAAHAAGVAVQVWTVDSASEMTRLLDLGVDGLMTDRPSLLREVLQARGAWPSADEKQQHRSIEEK